MRISSRLSLIFSMIASAIFVAFGVTIFWFSSNHRRYAFEERLKERVIITEKIIIEKETFSSEELEKINNQILHTLPNETKEVIPIPIGNKVIPKFQYDYPEKISAKFLTREIFHFQYDKLQGISRIFRLRGKDYLVVVTAIDKVGHKNLTFLKTVIIILVLIGIFLISVGSFISAKRALLPISRKIDKANTISASNLHRRLNVYNPNDELGKMAIAFNKLLDRLEASFEAQKAFIRNASHEIRNPVTAIMGEAEIAMSRTRTIEEYRQSLTTISNEVDALNLTVNNLLQLSKVEMYDGNIQRTDIQFDKFIEEIKESFDFINPDNQVKLHYASKNLNQNYAIKGNKNLLKTAIINLIDNACKFSSNKIVDINIFSDAENVNLIISDQGIGIIQKDVNLILTPFFRGNNAIKVRGSGIGLSLSHKIINLHGGSLKIDSQIEMGTEVTVKLPLIVD